MKNSLMRFFAKLFGQKVIGMDITEDVGEMRVTGYWFRGVFYIEKEEWKIYPGAKLTRLSEVIKTRQTDPTLNRNSRIEVSGFND